MQSAMQEARTIVVNRCIDRHYDGPGGGGDSDKPVDKLDGWKDGVRCDG